MGLDRLPFWVWTLASLIIGPLLWYLNYGPVEPGPNVASTKEFQIDVLSAFGKTPLAQNIVVYPLADTLTRPDGSPYRAMTVSYTELVPASSKDNSTYFNPVHRYFVAEVPFKPEIRQAAPNLDKTARADSPFLPRDQLAGAVSLYTITDRTLTIAQVVSKVYGGWSSDRDAEFRNANNLNGKSASPATGGKDLFPPRTIQEAYSNGFIRGNNRQLIVPWDPAQNKTVVDWLNECERHYPWVQYHYAWWRLPKPSAAIYVGGTFTLLGVIWPTFLWSLTTLGLGPAPKETYDLSRFGRGKPEAKKPVPANELTEDDQARLAEMEAKLTESLKGGLGERNAPETATEAEVRKLTAATAEAPKMAATPEEQKRYEGTFYPVAKQIHKPEDEKKPDK